MSRCGNVSETLKAVRAATKMTQRDMAKVLGISFQYLNDIEHGRRGLTDERIVAVEPTGIRSALIGARLREYKSKMDWLHEHR